MFGAEVLLAVAALVLAAVVGLALWWRHRARRQLVLRRLDRYVRQAGRRGA